MLRLCSRALHRFLGFELAFEVDLDLWPVPHWDGEGDGFEAGDEVEGAFFWDGVEALGASVGMVRVPVGLVMRMVLGSGWVTVSVEREMTGRMNCSGCWSSRWRRRLRDFDGGLGEDVGEVVVGFAGG